MEEVFFVVFFFAFVIIMTAMIGAFIVKAKSAKHSAADSSVGLRELEERIQKAVESANEPLRKEIHQLRNELESLQPRQKKLEGGAIHETPLLAERGRRG